MKFGIKKILWLLLFIICTASRSNISAVASSTQAPATTPPNILFIIVDTLRPDHTTPYGYSRDTTPNLNALVARKGARFADVTSVAPWTSPAISSLLTGQIENSYGVNWQHEDASIPASVKTLASYLREGGYATAGFASAVMPSRKGFGQGFDKYQDQFDAPPGRWDAVRAAQINQAALGWLQNDWLPSAESSKPLFLMLHYFDPHSWYDPPAPYNTLYDPTYTGTVTSEVFELGKPVMSGELKPTLRDTEHLLALYDGEIAYWDSQLGQLWNELDTLHLLDNTVVVVVADHGEMFGEHDKWLHRTSLYEETLRVPLLIRYTDVISAGLVISTPIQSMDIMPTLLDLAQQPIPTKLDALNLQPLLNGVVPTQDRLILSKIDAVTDTAHSAYWLNPHFDLRSVRQNEQKLINKPEDPTADELYSVNPSSLYETENLLAQQSSLAEVLRWQLYQRLEEGAMLSGKVADIYGNEIGNVGLWLNDRESGTTATSGVYTIEHVPPQSYLMMPVLPGFSFWPPTQTVSIITAHVEQNFVALGAAVSTTVVPTQATRLVYSDTLDLPTRIELPTAAFTESVGLVFAPRIVSGPSGFHALGPAFELRAMQQDMPMELPPNQPFTITLTYSDLLFAQPEDEHKAGLYWLHNGDWVRAEQSCPLLTAPRQDLSTNRLIVAVCQLGEFALMQPNHRIYLPAIQSTGGTMPLASDPVVEICFGENGCSIQTTLQQAFDEAMRFPDQPVMINLPPGIYSNWSSALTVQQKQWTNNCNEASYVTSFLLSKRNAPT